MRDVFICDAVRTPVGRYGGALAKVRSGDLAAIPIRELKRRNPKADWEKLDEVFFGCANQAGEDNRNVARMALLLAGLPGSVPGVTLNRLCALRPHGRRHTRTVARMALLPAALPGTVPGVTLNRLCASGLEAVGTAARAIRAGEMEFAGAGGGGSVSRAPFVQGKAEEAFSRSAEIYDTTIGWRFINPLMKKQYGVDSMPGTAEDGAGGFPGRGAPTA